MITPVNGHLVIEPVKQESFVVRDRETYEEVGVVKAIPELFEEIEVAECPVVGDIVYFDSWLASRFPGDKEGEDFWLVRVDDIRAIKRKDA